ncbi:MAG: hypothetical protein ACRCU6_07435, partial [Fusobacteriaceae bacterium]
MFGLYRKATVDKMMANRIKHLTDEYEYKLERAAHESLTRIARANDLDEENNKNRIQIGKDKLLVEQERQALSKERQEFEKFKNDEISKINTMREKVEENLNRKFIEHQERVVEFLKGELPEEMFSLYQEFYIDCLDTLAKEMASRYRNGSKVADHIKLIEKDFALLQSENKRLAALTGLPMAQTDVLKRD